MSAESPWNTHTVLGMFHPDPIFAAEMTVVSPIPFDTMLNRWPKPLAIWEDTIPRSSAIPITFKQHCSTGEGIL